MKQIVLETFIDSMKLFPFLFLTFLLMEYFEHKMSKKTKRGIEKAGKWGPLVGGLLGAFPQCGFSVVATNFYVARIISLGTLIAIYLSTSDEMLPILISEKANASVMIQLVGLKVIVGILFGLIIDFIFRNRKRKPIQIEHLCQEQHCDCKHGILKSSLKHSIRIMLFIFVITFLLNIGFTYLGEKQFHQIFMKDQIFFGPFLASLIGLIPNCGASVVLTELYLNHVISFASVVAGLLSSSGVSLLFLFKINKNIKENFMILGLVYFLGAIVGVCINFLSLVFA